MSTYNADQRCDHTHARMRTLFSPFYACINTTTNTNKNDGERERERETERERQREVCVKCVQDLAHRQSTLTLHSTLLLSYTHTHCTHTHTHTYIHSRGVSTHIDNANTCTDRSVRMRMRACRSDEAETASCQTPCGRY